jgi:hypothetical protein
MIWIYPGLKPRAESCYPFGIKTSTAVHEVQARTRTIFEDEDDDDLSSYAFSRSVICATLAPYDSAVAIPPGGGASGGCA